MAEPFKNAFNADIIKNMATHFAKQWSHFDSKGFIKTANHGLETLELKARSAQITDTMQQYLPQNYIHATEIMLKALAKEDDSFSESPSPEEGIAGWAIMPMTHYVARYGLEHFDLSMNLLKEMTKRFSSEFDIRFFILADRARALDYLNNWVNDANPHVRRLVSEGSRPRLPWAMQLTGFVKDPSPILPLLEQLKDDDSEYVRRSVANNLNDIAKDHPDKVSAIAKEWLKDASKERQKLVRHACRTLIKQGHKKTLSALGYGPAKISLHDFKILSPKVIYGDALHFEATITSEKNSDQALIIDYIIHHQKANGSTTPKVFKWKTFRLVAGTTKTMKRKHAMKPISTRVYYAGKHNLEIIVNGESFGVAEFELVMQNTANSKT